MAATGTDDSRARPLWPALALVVAIAAAYANSVSAPFVYDDTAAIVDNPTIRHLGRLGEILGPQPQGGLTVSGRPVLNLSFALSYAVSGPAPWGHHVFNILVHAGSALLLFGILRRSLNSRGRPGPTVTLAIAALWALHPLQTQAVTYTVQRAESLMGFFYLLTLYAFVRAVDAGTRVGDPGPASATPGAGRPWFTLSIVACALGMATKEVMATAPLLVLLYDRTFVARSFAAAWRTRRGYYVGLAGTWLLLAALLATTGGNRGGTAGLGVGVPWWAYGLTQFQAVTRYVALSFWPHPLVFEYGTFWVKNAAEVVPSALVVAGLLAGTAWALWRRPAAGFLAASFFLILSPTSLTPGTIQMIVEHRMYLPLAAVVTGAVLLGQRLVARPAAWALAAGAVLVLTVARNHDYRSALALWSDTAAKRPENPRAHEGLAEALTAAGRVAEAIGHRRESVRLLPDEAHYHYNLALTLAEAGQLEDAIRHYELSLRLAPNEPKTHNNLAIALGRSGRLDAALPHYAAAVRLRPNEAQYEYNYGVALLRAGRAAEAVPAYEAALRVQPDHADAHFNLGSALVALGRPEEAIAHYRAAAALRPPDAEYHATLGNALLALRQFDEAIAEFEAVLRRAPNHADARFKLANALFDADRVPAAVQQYQAAIRLRPADAEAHHNLGAAFARLERWAEAEAEFKEALRLRPDYGDARRHLEQLQRVLGR